MRSGKFNRAWHLACPGILCHPWSRSINLSGWLYLGFFVLMLIPFVNFLAWIGLIVVMCLPGTAGPNKYGEDPLNPVSVNTFE